MSNDTNCFFCGNVCEDYLRVHSRGADRYICKHCGFYYVTDFVKSIATENKHLIAGYLYETNRTKEITTGSEPLEISSATINSILNDGRIPKTLSQKLDKLLIWMHKNTNEFGEWREISDIPPSVAYARSKSELRSIAMELESLDYVDCSVGRTSCSLNSKGHQRAEELMSTNIDSNKVFVAMEFKSDLLAAMDNAIRPACAACGFDAFLIKDEEHNNGITDEIIASIKKSKFVITDFTYNNCGAYFEAGYAAGLGREVIRLCKKGWYDSEEWEDKHNLKRKDGPHFDVQHYNFIMWENEESLLKDLKNRIRAIIPGAILEDKEESA